MITIGKIRRKLMILMLLIKRKTFDFYYILLKVKENLFFRLIKIILKTVLYIFMTLVIP